MRLGIDAREIENGVFTGIGRPLVNFLEYFSVQNSPDTCVLFSTKKVPINCGVKVSNVVIKEGNRFIWDQWHLPRAIKVASVGIFYSPYYKIPILKPCLTVSAILDLMYLAYEPYYEKMSIFSKLYYAVFGRICAHQADMVLTCSQYSKTDIERIYGVRAEKIQMIPLSVAPLYFAGSNDVKVFNIKKKFDIPGRYILYMGNFKPHKNVEFLIDAFAQMANDIKDVILVLAGPLEHRYPQLLERIEQHGLKRRVIFTGMIKEGDEPQYLYQGAEVFVMPSMYEGFGLPPLEAMASGAPVVAVNRTAVSEIVRGAGMLIEPNDVDGMSRAIRRILDDLSFKQDLIAKGFMRARAYEASKISKTMLSFFLTVEDLAKS